MRPFCSRESPHGPGVAKLRQTHKPCHHTDKQGVGASSSCPLLRSSGSPRGVSVPSQGGQSRHSQFCFSQLHPLRGTLKLSGSQLLWDSIPFPFTPAFRPSPPEQPQGPQQGWGSPRGKLAAANADTVWSASSQGELGSHPSVTDQHSGHWAVLETRHVPAQLRG